jgi:type IV secretion system protein VirD4
MSPRRAARSGKGKLFVLDPFEVSGQPSAAFNPLAGLESQSLDLAEDVALISYALVYDPPQCLHGIDDCNFWR